jgi:integrase
VARRGRRGDGTHFYSRSDRRWIARFPHGPDGEPLKAKLRTEDAAKAQLAAWRSRYGGRTVSADTLDAWWAEWFPGHAESIRPSTATSYRGHWTNYISPLLGGMALEALDGSDVRRLIAAVTAKGRKPGTVHLVIRTLSVALNAAVAEGKVPRNVTVGVRLPRIDREPIKAMTEADRDGIVRAVRGTWVELPVRVLIGSGMRLGEVMGLDQRDLVLEAGYVRVRVTKTTVRAIPLTDDAVAALREAVAAAPRLGPAEPVFFSPRANRDGHRDRMLGSSVSHAFPRILQAAGDDRLHPHALRHGVATMMLQNGASLRMLMEQMGWKNTAMATRYAHIVPEAQREAIRSVGTR